EFPSFERVADAGEIFPTGASRPNMEHGKSSLGCQGDLQSVCESDLARLGKVRRMKNGSDSDSFKQVALTHKSRLPVLIVVGQSDDIHALPLISPRARDFLCRRSFATGYQSHCSCS